MNAIVAGPVIAAYLATGGIAVVPRVLTGIGVVAGIWVAAGLVLGMFYSETWATSLAFIQLARRWETPVRLMRFLEDAQERGVLRTVGPVYQFRHARLQDRMAARVPTSRSAHDNLR